MRHVLKQDYVPKNIRHNLAEQLEKPPQMHGVPVLRNESQEPQTASPLRYCRLVGHFQLPSSATSLQVGSHLFQACTIPEEQHMPSDQSAEVRSAHIATSNATYQAVAQHLTRVGTFFPELLL